MYLDDIDRAVSVRRAQFRKTVLRSLFVIVSLLVVSMIATVALAVFFSRRVHKGFDTFTEFFRRTAGSYEKISEGTMDFEEFNTLALVANRMVDDLKRSRAELSESQRMRSTLMGNLSGMAYRSRNDSKWSMEFVSEGAKALTGYSPSELDGNRVASYGDLIHPDDRHRVWEEVQECLKHMRRFELFYRIIPRGGGEKWVWEQGCGVFSEDGSLAALEGYVLDITNRVVAEEGLRRQNEYMEALHETSLGIIGRLEIDELLQVLMQRATALAGTPDGYFCLYDPERNDLELKVGFGVFSDLAGYRLELGVSLAGKVWQDRTYMVVEDYRNWPLRDPNPRFDGVFSNMAFPLMAKSEVYGVIGVAHSRKGRRFSEEEVRILERFAELASIALYNARLYSAMERELRERRRLETERSRMENRLMQAQKMEAIGTLAGGIAHDFNNILSAVIGYSDMALHDAPEGSMLRDNMEQVLQAGQRAKELVNLILAFSRKAEQHPRLVDVTRVLDEVLSLLRASIPTTIEIRRRTASLQDPVLADPIQIHQIIMNLCTNAAHAMEEEGGVLEVDVETSHEGPGPGRFVKLTVKDTGCGMDPDVMERIFDPYFTTKERGKGTGMGLAVVHGLVKAMGGAVHVDSRPGRGSVFEVLFPSSEGTVADDGDTKEELARGKERILFVDDEESLVKLGKRMLERLGYRVAATVDPLAALGMVREAPSSFDLVITDMTMPHMTGEMLAREIIRLRPDMPVILCTGYSEQMNEEKAVFLGVRRFLMKPLDMAELARVIRSTLDELSDG